jgi:hypothetical protein
MFQTQLSALFGSFTEIHDLKKEKVWIVHAATAHALLTEYVTAKFRITRDLQRLYFITGYCLVRDGTLFAAPSVL